MKLHQLIQKQSQEQADRQMDRIPRTYLFL